jgi:hypothetical protein
MSSPETINGTNNETPEQALEQVRFQLDLLRLTAVPLALGGTRPEAAGKPAEDAERVLAELTHTAASLNLS